MPPVDINKIVMDCTPLLKEFTYEHGRICMFVSIPCKHCPLKTDIAGFTCLLAHKHIANQFLAKIRLHYPELLV